MFKELRHRNLMALGVVVLVSCPSDVDAKDPVTFVVTVAGGNPETKLTYEWSLTAGKIISGQATSKLTVDVSGATGKPITATVSVGGVEPACVSAASCAIGIRVK